MSGRGIHETWMIHSTMGCFGKIDISGLFQYQVQWNIVGCLYFLAHLIPVARIGNKVV